MSPERFVKGEAERTCCMVSLRVPGLFDAYLTSELPASGSFLYV